MYLKMIILGLKIWVIHKYSRLYWEIYGTSIYFAFYNIFNGSHVNDFITALNRSLALYVFWVSLPCIPGLTGTHFVALASLEFIIILPQASTSSLEMNITSKFSFGWQVILVLSEICFIIISWIIFLIWFFAWFYLLFMNWKGGFSVS